MIVTTIIIGLATGYLTFAFCHKNGMFNLFYKIRVALDLKVLRCSFCLSFYIALVLHCLVKTYFIGYLEILLSAFASAAISSYFNAQVIHFYQDGEPDGSIQEGEPDDSIQEDRPNSLEKPATG